MAKWASAAEFRLNQAPSCEDIILYRNARVETGEPTGLRAVARRRGNRSWASSLAAVVGVLAGLARAAARPGPACGRTRVPSPSPSAAPNRQARPTRDRATISSERDSRRPRTRAVLEDDGAALGREIRIRDTRHIHAAPIAESAPPVETAPVLATARARGWPALDTPRRSIVRAGRVRFGDAARSC
jgi:hypothetical protein